MRSSRFLNILTILHEPIRDRRAQETRMWKGRLAGTERRFGRVELRWSAGYGERTRISRSRLTLSLSVAVEASTERSLVCTFGIRQRVVVPQESTRGLPAHET